MADDLQQTVAAWCAERSLSAGAQAKIIKELTSRLDASLAQAYQDAEQQPHVHPPSLNGSDVC